MNSSIPAIFNNWVVVGEALLMRKLPLRAFLAVLRQIRKKNEQIKVTSLTSKKICRDLGKGAFVCAGRASMASWISASSGRQWSVSRWPVKKKVKVWADSSYFEFMTSP